MEFLIKTALLYKWQYFWLKVRDSLLTETQLKCSIHCDKKKRIAHTSCTTQYSFNPDDILAVYVVCHWYLCILQKHKQSN